MKAPQNSSTALPIGTNLSVDERLQILANLMVDRILEEETKYQDHLKTDPNAKRIYETCMCPGCQKRRMEAKSKVDKNIPEIQAK